MVCSLITNEERKVKEKSFIKKGKIFKYCQGGGAIPHLCLKHIRRLKCPDEFFKLGFLQQQKRFPTDDCVTGFALV